MRALRNLLLTATALVPIGALPAIAGPNGGVVVGGSANIQNQGSANVTVNQSSDKAIINWNLFNIGVGEKTTFNQPNSSSIALNRVVGGLGPSEILGTLTANGKVFVVNRDGIIFGAGAVVNTAGFLATTSDIKDADFMAGRFNFQIPGRGDASIVNMGTITATSGGFAALVAPGVRNSGTISAKLGTVALGAGNIFNLDFYGDRLITLGVGDTIATQVKDVATGQTLKSLVTNEGKLKARGGRVELTAAAARQVVDSVINTSGVIEANSIGLHNGQIVLSAATASSKGDTPAQKVRVSGTLSAAGKKTGTKGGSIVVTGEHIELAGATIDASGRDGGGKVLVGGDWGGGKPDTSLVSNQSAKLEGFAIPNASTVSVDAATRIDASAKDKGDGGKVVLWSDQVTSFAGTILALGGAQLGNGGFVETSSHGVLNVSGTVNAGRGGTWLLDPADILINSGLAATISASLNGGTNVTQQTATTGGGKGDIIVSSQILWNTSATLTLIAFRNIQINDASVNGTIKNTGAGNLVMRADSTGTGTGTIVMNASTFSDRVDWANSTGKVTVFYNDPNYASQRNFTVGNGNFVLASPSQLDQYMLVNTTAQLGSIGTNATTLGEKYAIGPATLNASGFTGFGSSTFNGVLTGNGGLGTNSTITNLAVNLFPFIGTNGIVRDLNVSGALSATSNGQSLGFIANQNNGAITNVTTAGTINGGSFNGITAGGLVAQNMSTGTISGSQSSVAITIGSGITGPSGFNYAGGLAGINGGAINTSSASGTISGGSNAFVGGLVGQNGTGFSATITASGASGNVSGAGVVGGLVGFNSSGGGSIVTGASTGNVSGNATNATVGGLVGQNQGLISNSAHGTGTISGNGSGGQNAILGGLVGSNNNSGVVSDSSVTNTTISGNIVTAGGLVAINNGGLVTGTAPGLVFVSGVTLTLNGASIGGGLVGINSSGATIHNASAAGTISRDGSAPATASMAFGGLVGSNSGNIDNSTASTTVNGGTGSAGGLVGQNEGSIASSSASGNVSGTGVAATSANLGGLVGDNRGAITLSTASGNVSGGANSFIGGLAGRNENAATISSSTASGDVNLSDATGSGAGGAVGFNFGILNIVGATGNVTGGNSSDIFRAGSVGGLVGMQDPSGSITTGVASGNVSGGSNVAAGGLVGFNNGTITGSVAGGTVSSLDNSAGGLVAFNGAGATITASFAIGNVSGGGMNVGGFVGDNAGTINSSGAGGNVTATSASSDSGVGGFAANNSGTISGSFAIGNVTGHGSAGGFVASNSGSIDTSFAGVPGLSTVTVGDNATAGGFVSGNHGQITNSGAFGAVTGGANTVLGGFAAGHLEGTISDSFASGAVGSTGSNSIVGGFAGFNAAKLVRVSSSGPVSGTSESYLGGLVGFNIALIQDSTSTSSVTGSGSHNIAGGLVGANFGLIDPSQSSGNVSSGANSVVGGFVGVNGAFQFPGGQQFIGTISTDSSGTGSPSGGSGSTTGAQVGQNYPTSGLPNPPDPCTQFCGGTLFNPFPVVETPKPTPTPEPQPQPQQTPDNTVNVTTLAPLVNITATLVNDITVDKKPDLVITNQSGPTGGAGQGAGSPGGQKGGAHPGGARPPANVVAAYGLGALPSGMPPLNETRFRTDEAVFQLGANLSQDDIILFTRQLGLQILYQEKVELLGRTVLRVKLPDGATVRGVIAAFEKKGANFSGQPAYQYEMVQDVAQAPSPADTNRKGDSAQYIVDKLGLPEAHLVATGKDVKVAVIDSEIDANHPDLQGAVTGSYDALPSDDQSAHPHGTGMAGAIASHKRLLGVAPNARLLAVRAFGVNTGGAQGTSLNIVKGLQWAVDQGAKVINMSFAGPKDPILQQAIKRLTDQGIILIAAAGNAGPKSPPLFPGADPNVIAVSATDIDDKTYKGANRGKYVAISAPGVDILVPAPDGGYQLTTGTSVAAAHISGVVALMLERNKELKPAEVRSILAATAKNIGGVKTDVGAGLVDPVQAIAKSGPKQALAR